MQNIIDRLYEGNIRPAEQIMSSDPNYTTVMQEIYAELKSLKSQISPAGSERVKHLDELYLMLCSMECSAGFSYGFRLGAMLMQELLANGEPALTQK